MLTLEALPGNNKEALLRSNVVPELNVMVSLLVPPSLNVTLPVRPNLDAISCCELEVKYTFSVSSSLRAPDTSVAANTVRTESPISACNFCNAPVTVSVVPIFAIEVLPMNCDMVFVAVVRSVIV